MNPVLIPAGKREKYKDPIFRELFWEVEEQNLYIYDGAKWILIAGKWKNNVLKVGDNLEIVFEEDDVKKERPILRLLDDIDINTMELGKFSENPRWKGTVFLGKTKDCTFFPLLRKSQSEAMIGGKFLIYITRAGGVEKGIYQLTTTSFGKGVIFGSDDRNAKCSLNLVTLKNGTKTIGFKTQSTKERITTYEEVDGGEYGVSSEVWFIINSHTDIRLWSNNGSAKFERRMDIINQSNPENNELGCHWFELGMEDFRTVTGIPLNTGSSLDQFDNSCYVYFDIFFDKTDSSFSIDRAFITTKRAPSGSEDPIVSEGRIWCHNPYWMVPNDQHTVDVSDGFTFIPTVFDDSSNNTPYEAGGKYKIMDVYMVVPGQKVLIPKTTEKYTPPESIEVWFNGWDCSGNLKADLDIKEDDIVSSVILARD